MMILPLPLHRYASWYWLIRQLADTHWWLMSHLHAATPAYDTRQPSRHAADIDYCIACIAITPMPLAERLMMIARHFAIIGYAGLITFINTDYYWHYLYDYLLSDKGHYYYLFTTFIVFSLYFSLFIRHYWWWCWDTHYAYSLDISRHYCTDIEYSASQLSISAFAILAAPHCHITSH